jgi:hypothetical protein
MTPAAIAILILSLTTAGGLGWGALEHRARTQERTAAQQAAQDAAGALAACEAMTGPESLRAAGEGTTDALTVALAADVEEIRMRADFIRSLQSAELTTAMLGASSPQLLAAERAMDRCASLIVSKGADVAGCGSSGPVVSAWSAAVAALPACPEPTPPVLESAPATAGP